MDGKNKHTLWNLPDRLEGDKVVWIIVLMLVLISIVCIFSSTSRLLEEGQTRLDIMRSQLIIVGVGMAVIVLLYNIKDMKFFRICSMLGFPISFILLLMLDMHIDTPAVKALNLNHAYRSLKICGVQVHVFEIVKVAMTAYLAWAQDSLKKGILKGPKKEIWKKIVFVYAPFLLTFVMIIPGSNSSALFIGFIMFVVILLGGGNFRDMSLLLGAGTLLLLVCFSTYKLSSGKIFGRIGTGIERVSDHTDYEAIIRGNRKGSFPYQQALDKIRQPYSAKIAIHQGLVAKGPGQSTQRYVVPDISEDYMFSFIIEEYSLLGGIFVLALYVSLLARGSIIVRNCGKDQYAKLTVAGLCLLISGQAFLHMLVNVDIGPMTGQTLPLISHGNSAFLCFSVAFGIILSFSRIAKRRIEAETRNAAPLTEVRPTEGPGEEKYDEFSEYGV